MEEKKSKRSKKFLEQPQYPGGRKALDEFIKVHLQYPEDAMKQHLEGVVTVAYQVNDEGEVENVAVIKGLSPSCNDEAVRLVRMLKYGKAHNRGYRLKSNCKLHIHFKLAPQPLAPTIQFTLTPARTTPKRTPKRQTSYSYSISINQ